jgi:hypothetical protein
MNEKNKTEYRDNKISKVALKTTKEIVMDLYRSFSDQACKAGFSSLWEFLKIYEVFDYLNYEPLTEE